MISEREMQHRPDLGDKPQTLGEYRVGISFNPSANSKVDTIKRSAADLIDYLEAQKADAWPEKLRLIAHAQTLIEDAAMNGVKAVTKPSRG